MLLNPSFILVIFVLFSVELTQAVRLSVSGKNFIYNGKTIFQSGVNFAWYSYGYDFGNGQYAKSRSTLELWLKQVASNGGNSVRVWLHVEGDNTPNYDSNGYILSPDKTGTLITDLKSFLDSSKSNNILVTFVLWNGALLRNQNTVNLFWDNSKLKTYIDKALTPMVKALAGHPALGAWEIINEPEGLIYNNRTDTSNNCFDTRPLVKSGAGWVGKFIPMKQVQLFINWQAAAIKTADSGALVTVGSWAHNSQTDAYSNSRNYYSDNCLVAAGGLVAGKLDFYQIHTYAPYGTSAPFKVIASQYSLTKPLVIGEFSSSCSGGMTIQSMYNYAYNNGYQGAWGWQYAGGYCSDSISQLNSGMLQLKGKTGLGGLVNFPLV